MSFAKKKIFLISYLEAKHHIYVEITCIHLLGKVDIKRFGSSHLANTTLATKRHWIARCFKQKKATKFRKRMANRL